MVGVSYAAVVFLDLDDLDEGLGVEHVNRSKHLVAFITRGYCESENCMRELCRAVLLGIPITLLLEPERDGAMDLDQIKAAIRTADETNLRTRRWGLAVDMLAWQERGEVEKGTLSADEILAALTVDVRVFSRVRVFAEATFAQLAEAHVKPTTTSRHPRMTNFVQSDVLSRIRGASSTADESSQQVTPESLSTVSRTRRALCHTASEYAQCSNSLKRSRCSGPSLIQMTRARSPAQHPAQALHAAQAALRSAVPRVRLTAQ